MPNGPQNAQKSRKTGETGPGPPLGPPAPRDPRDAPLWKPPLFRCGAAPPVQFTLVTDELNLQQERLLRTHLIPLQALC